MEIVLLLVRMALFGVFFLAGAGKLMDLAGSEKAVKDFGIPEPLVKPISLGLPIFELLIAYLLLFTSVSWFGAVGAFLILLAFIVGMIYQMSKGNAPDCHCFGQMHSEPVGISSLVRNIVLALLAGVLVIGRPAFQGAELGLTDGELVQSVALLTTLMLAFIAVIHVRKIIDNQGNIIRRLDVMEMVAGDGEPLERKNAGDPTDGLPIGAPFPDFALADLSGKVTTFEHIFSRGKPMLFFFIGPACGPCKALYPEIEAWKEEFGEKISFVLVSTGPAEINRDRYAGKLESSILLQKDRELAKIVYAKWTPTAIFVDVNGNVASHPAAGDTAVRDLIEKIRKDDPTRENVFFRIGASRIREPKIGTAIPPFELDGIGGEKLTEAAFQGSKTLTVFLSLTCPHCQDMVEEIKAWEPQRSNGDPKVVVFSDGDLAAHREWGLSSPVIIDPKYGTAVKLGMQGTPSGVLVNEEGVIVTETAIGAPNIWALIGRRRDQ